MQVKQTKRIVLYSVDRSFNQSYESMLTRDSLTPTVYNITGTTCI